ncbi:MAG TPA: nucleotidyl transferase AbiEii/AbiGii toxin family protein [Candidatus Babeliaceae bacterium]|nr:nucleotidyl transferase AbiEii/AbiGii toxin family protein [Candidatus Babeliaceae bacterium]
MIEKKEILTIAKSMLLDPSTIEKDYVIGWLLKGIYQHREIQNSWVFKGGTSIKKCYIDNYRFSEDLDFSLLNPPSKNPSLEKIFSEISSWIYDQAGIEIPHSGIEIETYRTPHGWEAIQAKLTYNGPLKRKTNFPRVKIDLSLHEKIVLKPEERLIYHTYSDNQDDIKAQCYPFEELFAEKIRALAERTRPRDIYDVIHLYKSRKKLKSKKLLLQVLEEKCKFKGISLPHLQTIETRLNISNLNTEWERMLAHQLPQLVSFEESWSFMPTIFTWLYSDANEQT